MKTLSIGSLKLKNPLVLAPMLDITNLPFRLLCRKSGASLAFTEMIYTDAIIHKNKKTAQMMSSSKEDKPLGIQITCPSSNNLKNLSPFLKKYALVDLNCGCPSQKITGTQAGSYLLNNPEKISKIIKALKHLDLNVTAKIRLGFKKNNLFKVAKAIEKAGADAITLHPRLASQGYEIPADHNWTKKLKPTLSIPLIANGDIFTPEKAEEILEFSDGIMIARGAIGNPLIFKQILHYLKTKKHLNLTQKQKISQFKEYLKLSKKYKIINLQQAKHLGFHFIRGFDGAQKIRKELNAVSSFTTLNTFIKSIPCTNNL